MRRPSKPTTVAALVATPPPGHDDAGPHGGASRRWFRLTSALVALLGLLAMHGVGSDHDLGMSMAAAESSTAMVGQHAATPSSGSSFGAVDAADNAWMPPMAMTGCVATLRSVTGAVSAPAVGCSVAGAADVAAGAAGRARVTLSPDPRPPDLTRLCLSRT